MIFYKELPKDKGEFLQQQISLNKFQELRIANNYTDFIYVRLVKGQAEIFG